ncbi:MAG: N-(5'-phosphoribosyl)anthranilate isomerase, partial [Haliea sp.]|nr:N-(5'-phosphoribosyl)anthranilate isomerase [Haliea sp.]
YGAARGLLLDSWQPGVPGGTGTTFDWSSIPAQLPRPLVLAGGLDAHNVASAIAAVKPSAVDVSGGVERAPGIKDVAKMQRFIAAVHG